MCHVSRGHEGILSKMLEVRARMGFVLRPHLCADRPATRLPTASRQGSHHHGMDNGKGPTLVHGVRGRAREVIESRTQEQQRSGNVARRRSTVFLQRQWQGTGATCTATGPHAAASHALPCYDASISTADDATSTSTAYDRQGSWERSTSPSSRDVHDWSACTRYGSSSSYHALGINWTDDSLSCSTLVPYGTCHHIPEGWPSPTEVEQTFEGDEEGGRQSLAAPAVDCSRDAEAGREEQHQEPSHRQCDR